MRKHFNDIAARQCHDMLYGKRYRCGEIYVFTNYQIALFIYKLHILLLLLWGKINFVQAPYINLIFSHFQILIEDQIPCRIVKNGYGFIKPKVSAQLTI